jgi:hypothetical protein
VTTAGRCYMQPPAVVVVVELVDVVVDVGGGG